MLIKLLPEQLVKFWDMLRFAIAETFVPRNSCTNLHLRTILASLLSGKSQCWIAFKMIEDKRTFVGFIVSRIAVEPAIGEKVLSLDTVYAYQGVPEEILFESMKVLESFALKNNCSAITGMTESDRTAKLAKKLGFTTRQYLVKEVSNG
jgi:hypothetical protein